MPITAPEPEIVAVSEEQLQVRRWRIRQLSRAGYPAAVCIILADDADVDLHVAVELLEHGCPVTTAARILGWPL